MINEYLLENQDINTGVGTTGDFDERVLTGHTIKNHFLVVFIHSTVTDYEKNGIGTLYEHVAGYGLDDAYAPENGRYCGVCGVCDDFETVKIMATDGKVLYPNLNDIIIIPKNIGRSVKINKTNYTLIQYSDILYIK